MIETADKQFYKIRTLLLEGRTDDALLELDLLLARQPDFGKGQALLGRLLFRFFQNFTTSEEAFRKAMKHSPDYPELYFDYSELLLQLERFTETVAVLNKAMEIPGIEKDKVYFIFGKLYERQLKWDEAINYYGQALQYTFSDEVLKDCDAAIARCLKKKNFA
jgi:tetratricopeptide (TPR) repeat protein